MGYISDVELVVATESKDDLDKVLSLWCMTDEYQEGIDQKRLEKLKMTGEFSRFDMDLHYVRFCMDNVKWYGSYVDVRAFVKLTELITELGDREEDESMPVGYGFVRVGEDQGDLVQEFGGDVDITDILSDEMYIESRIVIEL